MCHSCAPVAYQSTDFVQIWYLWSFSFLPMLRVFHIRNKKRTEWQICNFTNVINCFCCYVIKSAGGIAKKVLLSVIWNILLIEMNLSQIRISDSKREKLCAVCPYLLFFNVVLKLSFIYIYIFNIIQKKQILNVVFNRNNNVYRFFLSLRFFVRIFFRFWHTLYKWCHLDRLRIY